MLILGSSTPNYLFEVGAGDHAEVLQDVDVTDFDLVRARMRLRVPRSLRAGYEWEASVIVDGAKRARAICRKGRARELTDLAANVSKMTGVHRVGVRLELVEA